MAYFERYSSYPNCHSEATALTFRNIYQCNDCGRHYCDRCCVSGYLTSLLFEQL
jgi:hypothetical protein